jgi:hypothetical protein
MLGWISVSSLTGGFDADLHERSLVLNGQSGSIVSQEQVVDGPM